MQISQQDMDRAIKTKRIGTFFSRMGVNDYIGYANLDGSQILYRGNLADVLDMFVPFDGETVVYPAGYTDGVEVTRSGVRHVPMHEFKKKR